MSRPLFHGRGLALVGYRGTGKSTVGRLLAERLGRPFVDADAALEARYGRSIRSVFEDLGEPVFRDWEEAVLAELAVDRASILSTGGGVVLRESNRRTLKTFGYVIWLSAGPEILAGRLSENAGVWGRPALTAAGTLGEIADVLRAREPLYREVADAVVATDGLNPAEVVEAVLTALPQE